MKKILNDLLFLFPIMFYYLLEALIVGMIISVFWRFLFADLICELNYLQIVFGYWVLKLVLFDVFKLITGLQQIGNNVKVKEENYNESINQ